ncbi:MAG: hypothetical protein M3Q32_07150 [Pseudomonadota bacterium]|nr:hypothetical protein [Burkholderiales bacterium]MDQ3196137.1 hypothetical protein [Pseudomonadota bacterium]
MAKTVDTDDILKNLASEAVKQGENVRTTVRDLTLKALQARELSLGQIKQVLKSVTAGVNLGAADAKIDVEKTLTAALAGMDDALLKAARASQVALQQLSRSGEDFEQSQMKTALNELQRLEDEFLKTVQEASEGAETQVKSQWAAVLRNTRTGGTETGAQVAATIQQYTTQAQAAMRAQREAGLKTAHLLTQNFATLASGVLIGMTEAMQQQSSAISGASKNRKD